jgi:DNA mismatch endonuclease (patch repair protein)
VFSNSRVAIFVDGCFWHGCPKHGTMPNTNRDFWCAKLRRNKARDRAVNKALGACGWRVLRVWQHELCVANERRLIRRIRIAITQGSRPRPPAPSRQGRSATP